METLYSYTYSDKMTKSYYLVLAQIDTFSFLHEAGKESYELQLYYLLILHWFIWTAAHRWWCYKVSNVISKYIEHVAWRNQELKHVSQGLLKTALLTDPLLQLPGFISQQSVVHQPKTPPSDLTVWQDIFFSSLFSCLNVAENELLQL